MQSFGEAGPIKKGRWERGEDGVIRVYLTDESSGPVEVVGSVVEEKEKDDGDIQQVKLEPNGKF